MEKIFEMTDLGVMKYFLGMEVLQSSDGTFICQQKYISDILSRFKMQDCKPVSTPISAGVKLGKDEDSEKMDDSMYRSLIGSLLYLTAIRPDILFIVSFLSKFMHSSRDTRLTAAKRVLRYIKGTSKFGIFFPTSAEVTMNLIGYSDSDWGGGVDDSRSTSGYLFCLGTSCFSWSSRKQETKFNQQLKLST